MTAWIDSPMLGFDTETTGVDVTSDRIVTAALVRRDGTTTTTVRTWLVDPGVEIPAGATAVHGITTEQARADGMAPQVALAQIADELTAAARRGEPVVAFNAGFDLGILEAELTRHGLPTMIERLGGPLRAVVDPLVLDRYCDRYRRGKRRLGDLCDHYQVVTDGLHTADVDVVATLDVLRAIVRCHPWLADLTPEELHRHQVEAHRTWAMSFNAWRQRQGLTGPGAETCWPVREPALA